MLEDCLVSLDIAGSFLLAAEHTLPLRIAKADALLAAPHQVEFCHSCPGSHSSCRCMGLAWQQGAWNPFCLRTTL